MKGLIVKGIGGFYYVKCGSEVYECKAKGKFKKMNISPFPGDNVEIELDENNIGNIVEILPRKNFFKRPASANIDKLFVIVSTLSPSPNYQIIDNIIAIAEFKDIKPYIVITKGDIGETAEIAEIYKKAGIPVFISENLSGNIPDELMKEFDNCISVLTGNSGVGKSSLLNLLLPELDLETGEISKKLGRGRHTTRSTELYEIGKNGYIADTPGFSTIETIKYDVILKEDLQHTFREFIPHIGHCKFNGCSHINEPGCSVKTAVEQGEIAKSRYDSYVAIFNEVSKIKTWELK